MNDMTIFRRGDILLADLDPYFGSEQGGTRPVLVLQNDVGNYYCPTLIVAPLTSRVYKLREQPTHYLLRDEMGGASVVLLEQIKTIDKRRIKRHLGHISHSQMADVDNALKVSLGLRPLGGLA